MNKQTKSVQPTSRIAGVLILLGIVVGIFSVTPSVDGKNFLDEVYPNKNQVLLSAIFQSALVPIYIGFSLVLYKVISTFNKPLSLGFVGFRIMAGTFQVLGVILLVLIVYTSEDYLFANSSNKPMYQHTMETLRLARDLINHWGVILATGLGNMMLYIVLCKHQLIPKWLSLWGIIGNFSIIIAGVLLLFAWLDVVSITYGLLSAPLVLQEIVLAVYFITKGIRRYKGYGIND